MLDALEWAVNKTRLGDARPNGLSILQPTVAQDHDSPSHMPREVHGIGDDQRRATFVALVRQPSTDPPQLQRREVAQVDQMEHWSR